MRAILGILMLSLAGAASAVVPPGEPCEQNGGYIGVEGDPPRWSPLCAEIVSGGTITWTNTGGVAVDPRSALDQGACFHAARDRPGALEPGESWTVHLRFALSSGLQVSLDGGTWRDCLLAMDLLATGIGQASVLVAPADEEGFDAGRIVVRRDSTA